MLRSRLEPAQNGRRNPRQPCYKWRITHPAGGSRTSCCRPGALTRRGFGFLRRALSARWGHRAYNVARSWDRTRNVLIDLSAEWPLLRRRNQSCAHRIHSHILPFLRFAFVASQDVIEKAALPFELTSSNNCLQRLDPRTERNSTRTFMDQQVQMIQHENVASRPPLIVLGTGLEKITETLVNCVVREETLAILNADGQKISRPQIA